MLNFNLTVANLDLITDLTEKTNGFQVMRD